LPWGAQTRQVRRQLGSFRKKLTSACKDERNHAYLQDLYLKIAMYCPSVRSWTKYIILDVVTSIFWFLLTSTGLHFFFHFFKDFHCITFTVFYFQSLSLSLNFNKIQSFYCFRLHTRKMFRRSRVCRSISDPFRPCSTAPGSVLVLRFRTGSCLVRLHSSFRKSLVSQ